MREFAFLRHEYPMLEFSVRYVQLRESIAVRVSLPPAGSQPDEFEVPIVHDEARMRRALCDGVDFAKWRMESLRDRGVVVGVAGSPNKWLSS